ncbi:Ig-like domain repeat protein [Methanobrevibacter sp.]|uniref:Ig-like domain repeat protein n=1 Tax=Methanobrevibacter sp. TaxID=66852 RepID=UPI00388D0705
MKRKFLILICLALFIVSIACVSAAEDVNQTVDNDALSVSVDNELGAKDNGTFTALQEKINNAAEGSTINLENDYKYDEGFRKEGISINKELKINGNGYTIDGSNGARIFEILSNDVTVRNIKFINGNAVNNQNGGIGAAIYNMGNNTNVIACDFINNSAAHSGGAIYAKGPVAIINCSFIANTADSSEYSAGSNFGGAIACEESFVINNCIFGDNGAQSGSSIYFELSTLGSMDNCTFADGPQSDAVIFLNKSLSYGAASPLKTDFTNLKFNDNLNLYGGAISFSNNILSIVGSHISTFISGNVYVDIAENTFRNTFDSEGKANFDLNFISNGTWDTKISYRGDGNFAPFEINIPITIRPVIKLNVPDVTKEYGGPERLMITLTESNYPIVDANVTININGQNYTKTTDIVGRTSLDLDFDAGSYDATVFYKDISKTAKVIINKLATKTVLYYNNITPNSFTLTAFIGPLNASGDVVFTVNGKDYLSNVTDGKATYTLNNLGVGSYSAVANYKGDVNHEASVSNSVGFDVKIEVIAPDLTKYYHGPERFVVTVTDDNKPVVGKNVTITLNGVPYKRTTDANGQGSMAINLNSGVHTAVSEFEGIKVQSTITVKPTISANNVTKIYRNDTQYYATFTDTVGNLLKNSDVNFNINGVFYTRKTNNQGVAKLNINLNPGNYIITAINPVSTERYGNLIKVLPSIVAYDLTKYYKNASQLIFRLLDNQGRPVGAGVSATININGVFYTKQSDASGFVRMNINLNPGTYIATIEHNGLLMSSTVKVLPILEAKDVVMKYRDGTKFEAKLLDGQGKPFANQTLTFNINGVMYNRITDGSGIARLNINLMPGEYIITSMYSNGAAIANRVTVRG